MTSREEVYTTIESERNYQDAKWGELNKDINSISAYTLWISYQVSELTKLASTEDER